MTQPTNRKRDSPRTWANAAAEDQTPPPGRQAMLIAKLALGLLLLGVQLWLLTVALDLYLSGDGSDVWTLALFSGIVFLGGLLALGLPGGRPRMPPRANRAARA